MQQGRETDHLHPSSAEVKNGWSYTTRPHFVFVAWCLVKHKDDFTFTSVTLNKIGVDELGMI